MNVRVKTDRREYTSGETVEITLILFNESSDHVKLDFTSNQRCDFIVLKEDQEVWRWSKDKVFAMVLGSLVLRPGDRQTYTEEWKPLNEPSGEYELVGVVTSRPRFEATCPFRII